MQGESRQRRAGTGVREVAATAAIALLLATPAMASEGGLVLMPRPDMLIALLVFFVLLIYPVNKLLFRPIFATLDAREDKISGTRARAEKIAADAETVLERYQQSIREAREAAEAARRERLAEAQGGAGSQLAAARAAADREIDEARGRIAADLAAARRDLRPSAEALAREAATRILGRSLS